MVEQADQAGSSLLAHSGVVALTGRPSVGKSSLVNRLVGEKVSIVSPWPQTTRFALRGILQRPGAQVVFVDTPGIRKPTSALARSLNDLARIEREGVDLTVLVVDGARGVGPGDRLLASELDPDRAVVAVNKIDRLGRSRIAEQLLLAAELGLAECFPVSAATGAGVDELAELLLARMPPGPAWYDVGARDDLDPPTRFAEAVREALLHQVRQELPYAITCRVTTWSNRVVVCEILVQRSSQRAIVIGRGGRVLASLRAAVANKVPRGAELRFQVKVVADWPERYPPWEGGEVAY
jgi:GTP-binding protein Era